MKFDVYFTIQGPTGVLEVSNNNNPVECESLEVLLKVLSKKLPKFNFGLSIVGLRLVPVKEE